MAAMSNLRRQNNQIPPPRPRTTSKIPRLTFDIVANDMGTGHRLTKSLPQTAFWTVATKLKSRIAPKEVGHLKSRIAPKEAGHDWRRFSRNLDWIKSLSQFGEHQVQPASLKYAPNSP
jgi:hypothetical protein